MGRTPDGSGRVREGRGSRTGRGAGGLESRRRVARSLSSRCRRDRHQTHSPWGRCRVGSGPGLPESQGVKVGENMTCLGNEFWNETYISEGSEGRAGQAWVLRWKHLEGHQEPEPSSRRAGLVTGPSPGPSCS